MSSASATIEATIGERFPLPPLANGLTRYDYGLVMAIFMGCVYFYGIVLSQIKVILVILLTMIGPEARKKDHIKEPAAEIGMDNCTDFSMAKGRSDGGHVDESGIGNVEKLEKERKHSEDSLENEGIGNVHASEEKNIG